MIIELPVKKKFDIRYLAIQAHVRYWEDGDVNGEDDHDILENPELTPRMPGATKHDDGEWWWHATIDLENGRILDWPAGVEARIHYKVCDEGLYTLLDEHRRPVAEIESYVPSCIGEMGDYIVLSVDGEGNIVNGFFTPDQEDVEEMISNAFGDVELHTY